MSSNATRIELGVCRMVQGDLYEGSSTDMENRPLVYKSGANIGQPRKEFFARFAVAKAGTADFKQTTWGQKMLATARAAFPQGQSDSALFSWKVYDGDSAVPNSIGNKPCDNEGWPGHWIVQIKGSLAPRTATIMDRAEAIFTTEQNLIKPGDYVMVNASIEANNNTLKPGIYVNFEAICLLRHGKRIITGPSISDMGFTNAALPAGAQLLESVAMPAETQRAITAPPPGSPPPPPSTALRDAAAGTAPPPPVVGPQPTAKANGATKESMLAWPGWDEATLVRDGYLA